MSPLRVTITEEVAYVCHCTRCRRTYRTPDRALAEWWETFHLCSP